MHKALAIMAAIATSLVAASAAASPSRGKLDVYPLGTLIDDAALNGSASTRSFVVETRGYGTLLLHVDYTHDQNGTITILPESSSDAAGTSVYTMTSCSTSSGACAANFVTGSTTSTLSADKDFALRYDVSGYVYVKVTVTHNGTPTASDKLSVVGYLIAG